MKKFLKVCLIIALILIILGLIIGIAGAITGGATDVWSMARRGELSWGDSFQDWEAEYDIDAVEIFDDHYQVYDGETEKTMLEAGTISDIQISIGGGQLYIEESEDDNYYIEAENIGRMQAYVNGDTLVVKGLKKTDFNNNHAKIWLYLPKEVAYDNVEIELGAGRMDIIPLQAKDMKISAGAGQVIAQSLLCENLKLEVGAGQITVKDCQVSKDMETGVGAGSISVEGSIAKDLNVDCAMGSTRIVLLGEEEDHNYEMSCAAGHISVGSQEMAGLVGEKIIDNQADSNFKLECAMGSVEILFKD